MYNNLTMHERGFVEMGDVNHIVEEQAKGSFWSLMGVSFSLKRNV